MQYIEICVQTHPVEDKFYTSYISHIFYTNKKYSHNELVQIMKNINQKCIDDPDWCCREIDFKNFCNQLSEFEIYQLIPVERYYFDTDEEE